MSKVRIKQLEDILASDVYLARDLKVTAKVGEINTFDPGKNYATVSCKKDDGSRKTVQEVIEEIFSKDGQPSVVQPSLSVAMKRQLGNGTEESISREILVEAGSQCSLVPYITFNPGRYSYGPDTGCQLTEITVKLMLTKTDGTVSADSYMYDSEARDYDIPAVGVENIYISAECNFSAATAPALTQLGNESGLRIEAGSIRRARSAGILYPAYPVFFGPLDELLPLEEDPDTLRSLSSLLHRVNPKDNLSLRITPGVDSKAVVLAFREEDFPGFKAVLSSSMGADITGNFEKVASDLTVRSLNGIARLGNYSVFLFAPDAFQGGEVIDITLINE